MNTCIHRTALLAGVLAALPLTADAREKLTEPVDVVVTNPVVPVEVANADPIAVSVATLPEDSLIPFSRQCELFGDRCTIDLTDLMATGEVHITYAAGAALDVGAFATPRFFNVGIAGPEVSLPPTIASLDTGTDRDVTFGQSMDLIPVGAEILFLEPDSTRVFFYLHGHVVRSSAASAASAASGANAALARDAAVPVATGTQSP